MREWRLDPSAASLSSGRSQGALDQVGGEVADGALFAGGPFFQKACDRGGEDDLNAGALRHDQNVV